MNHIDGGGSGGCGVSGGCSHGDRGGVGGGGSSWGGSGSGCINDCCTEHKGQCGLLIYEGNVIFVKAWYCGVQWMSAWLLTVDNLQHIHRNLLHQHT